MTSDAVVTPPVWVAADKTDFLDLICCFAPLN
jgi:hypothetical protein